MRRLLYITTIPLLLLSSVAFGQVLQKGDFAADTSSEGWSLNGGTGVRTHIIFVTFEKPFETIPAVVLSLSGYDAGIGKDGTVRVNLKTEKITREGFVVKVQTRADSRVGAVYGNWMAWASK
jgi:hypothetical protein